MLGRAGCLEGFKTKLAEMRNRRWLPERRLPSFPRFPSSGELAILVLGRLGQPGIHVDRFRDTRGDVALALVEEGRAAQASLQRYRRVAGARAAIGALDPGLAGQPVILGVGVALF